MLSRFPPIRARMTVMGLKARFCVGALTIALVTPTLFGGLRGPGKYNGVVLFDRWDNCYLFSGVYLMYVSETLKRLCGHSLDGPSRLTPGKYTSRSTPAMD